MNSFRPYLTNHQYSMSNLNCDLEALQFARNWSWNCIVILLSNWKIQLRGSMLYQAPYYAFIRHSKFLDDSLTPFISFSQGTGSDNEISDWWYSRLCPFICTVPTRTTLYKYRYFIAGTTVLNQEITLVYLVSLLHESSDCSQFILSRILGCYMYPATSVICQNDLLLRGNSFIYKWAIVIWRFGKQNRGKMFYSCKLKSKFCEIRNTTISVFQLWIDKKQQKVHTMW